jgi:hypothetical protein
VLATVGGAWQTRSQATATDGGTEEPMKRTLSMVAVLVLLLVGRPAVSHATTDGGQEFSKAIAAAALDLVYTPAKVLTAIVGLPIGAITGILTGGDVRSAYAVWVPTGSGTYFITPANLEGREPVQFFGSDYADQPSMSVEADKGGIYDAMYSR